MNVELRCTRRGCHAAITGELGAKVAEAAWADGWHHDRWFWWCPEHRPTPDTLPSPAPTFNDEDTFQP